MTEIPEEVKRDRRVTKMMRDIENARTHKPITDTERVRLSLRSVREMATSRANAQIDPLWRDVAVMCGALDRWVLRVDSLLRAHGIGGGL